MPDDERADGTLAAAAFTLFRNGADVVAVVTELRETPEKIEMGSWKRRAASLATNCCERWRA